MPTWSSINEEDAVEGQWFAGMSWTTRIQGFLLFTVLGFFASVMSWVALSTGGYWKYSVLSTMGNAMSLCSTVFLMGPARQLASMFEPTRRGATTAYLGSMVLTLFCALYFKSAVLSALCTMGQYAALVWYSLSYIPYGREMATGCLSSCSRVVLSV